MVAILLLAIPFIFSLLIVLLPARQSRMVTLSGTLLTLALAVFAFIRFSSGETEQLLFNIAWVPAFGIQFNIGIDGISMIMVLMTALLYPFIVASTSKTEIINPKAFYALMLTMELGLMGVFISKDAFLFYIFYELTLIPIYFICGIWGGARRIPVTLKFFIYTLAGSLFMLIAIIYLYFKTPGDHTFDITSFYQLNLSAPEQVWIFWAFFLAFAIKIPIFPFHTWQPDTYEVAPTAGTMLLAGIMLKMGLYGLIRFLLPVAPQGLAAWGNFTMLLCTVGIVYASLIAWRQQDLKRLIAYSSIAHVGLIAAGIFSLNASGVQGAIIQMFNHGVNVVALFYMIDIIEKRYGTRWMDDLGGVGGQMKRLSVAFMVVMLGSVGLPLTNGFVGEFLLLLGIYQYGAWFAAAAGLTLVLGAVYMFRLYRNVFLGSVKDHHTVPSDITLTEGLIIVPLCLLVVAVGVYPSLLLNVSESAVRQILQLVNNSNLSLSAL